MLPNICRDDGIKTDIFMHLELLQIKFEVPVKIENDILETMKKAHRYKSKNIYYQCPM